MPLDNANLIIKQYSLIIWENVSTLLCLEQTKGNLAFYMNHVYSYRNFNRRKWGNKLVSSFISSEGIAFDSSFH